MKLFDCISALVVVHLVEWCHQIHVNTQQLRKVTIPMKLYMCKCVIYITTYLRRVTWLMNRTDIATAGSGVRGSQALLARLTIFANCTGADGIIFPTFAGDALFAAKLVFGAVPVTDARGIQH